MHLLDIFPTKDIVVWVSDLFPVLFLGMHIVCHWLSYAQNPFGRYQPEGTSSDNIVETIHLFLKRGNI